MLFEVPSDTARVLSARARDAEPGDRALWKQLLGLSDKEAEKRLKTTKYQLTGSLERHLDALATAHVLKRPVLAVGPAASGKTVLGAIFAALLGKENVRTNFSASTEARDLTGGIGPVNKGGKTRFVEVDGPALHAADVEACLTADEWNLSKEARMALKSMLDFRRTGIDAERDVERPMASTFFYAAQNPTDQKSGRVALEPTILDAMFVVDVDSKPLDERVDIVSGQTALPREEVTRAATFFADLEIAAGKLKSTVTPITTTERDILKAAKAAEHFIARDGVTDAADVRAIVARETFRVVKDNLLDDGERELVWDKLITKAFEIDAPMPKTPRTFERVKLKDGTEVLQIGDAQLPVRELGKNEALDALIPNGKGLKDPIGPQIEVLESVLLAFETKQPVALVGTTGTGKTMLMRWLAKQLNWPVFEQAFHEDMTKDDILGAPVLKKDGRVEFQLSPLDNAVLEGGIFIGDEYLTLPNETRESTNPITEGSELQIPSRPPRTVKRDAWHENFRFVVTTNAGDIRKADFSMAEASRMRIVGVGEVKSKKDLETIAKRDFYFPGDGRFDVVAEADVKKVLTATKRAVKGKDLEKAARRLTRAYKSIRAAKDPALDESEAWVVAEIGKLPAELRLRIDESIGLPTRALSAVVEVPVVDGRLTSPLDVEDAVKIFCELRELQKARGSEVSPLTQRVFTSFLQVLTSLRARPGATFESAVIRAAELTLLSKVGAKNEKAALEIVEKIVAGDGLEESAKVPVIDEDRVTFGDTAVQKGALPAWTPDNRRFPLTAARCHNLALLADAVELGKGRPISCTDDENGETVETLREFGRLTGRRVTVVTLSNNVDVDGLIERLTLSKDPDAIGTFEPELQQIGMAVQNGDLLVLRGCGSIPSAKLERLNSLGDGRQSITLPKTGGEVAAHKDFRMVMLKKPRAPFGYSPALENRLLEPMLTTRAAGAASLDERAGELAAVLRERTNLSGELSSKLAAFHTYLNEVLKQGAFASGRQVGSFLNRDAEGVAQRLSWLLKKGSQGAPENELLHDLVEQVYGQRFSAEADRLLLSKLAQRAFGSEGDQLVLSSDAVRTPNLVKFGPWVLQADPRGVRDGVPGRDEILPANVALEDIQQKVFAALQFDEVVHLHGDDFVADATCAGVARLSTSTVVVVDGNEELSEQYLYGGLVQDPKTGKFEEHEGVLARAQREGATVVLKNASRVPDDVLLPLAELAATGMMSRVKGGVVETQPCAFRLVLQTSDQDPPLLSDLAQVTTRVGCPSVDDKQSLKKILGHTLIGVPGGPVIASALVDMNAKAQKLLDRAAFTGRQPLRFDSARAVEAARQIKAQVQSGIALEAAVPDVLVRTYLRPAAGLEIDEKLRVLLEDVGQVLADEGTLKAEAPPGVDDVEKPAVALLFKDYAEHEPELTAQTLAVVTEQLQASVDDFDAGQASALLSLVSVSDVVPEAVRQRATALNKGAKTTEREVGRLLNFCKRQPKTDTSTGETALEFMRGARLWDVEHRAEILDRYQSFFSSCAAVSGQASEDTLAGVEAGALVRVRERFEKTEAVEKVGAARGAVAEAFDAYQRRAGEHDDELSGLFKKLLESWDFVATSPIFEQHHLLRQELSTLSQLLQQVEAAHERRGEGTMSRSPNSPARSSARARSSRACASPSSRPICDAT